MRLTVEERLRRLEESVLRDERPTGMTEESAARMDFFLTGARGLTPRQRKLLLALPDRPTWGRAMQVAALHRHQFFASEKDAEEKLDFELVEIQRLEDEGYPGPDRPLSEEATARSDSGYGDDEDTP